MSVTATPTTPAGEKKDDLVARVPLIRLGRGGKGGEFQPRTRRLGLQEPLPDHAALKAGQRVFYVPTVDAGDERLVWNAGFLEEIREAKADFDKLVAEGMVPYRVDPTGKRSNEPMTRFDPNAEEVVFLPIHVPNLVVGG